MAKGKQYSIYLDPKLVEKAQNKTKTNNLSETITKSLTLYVKSNPETLQIVELYDQTKEIGNILKKLSENFEKQFGDEYNLDLAKELENILGENNEK